MKKCLVPRILVVLVLPRDQSQWLGIDGDGLIMRRCAFWLNLANEEPTRNISSKTVHLPRGNVFNCETAQRLLERVARQEPIE